MEQERNWAGHEHKAVDHTHLHFHVTHNANGDGFEHLSSGHEHRHDHAALVHSHVPHVDIEQEHLAEAHVHDHDLPSKLAATATGRGTVD
jgi:hypothetical protein